MANSSEILTAICRAANEKKISGYALAKITGLDARHVYRILNGGHSPSLDTVLKLCEAVGIELKIVNLGEMPAKTKNMTQNCCQSCGSILTPSEKGYCEDCLIEHSQEED